jgi:quercetin dioxygenase-like cupin family protein
VVVDDGRAIAGQRLRGERAEAIGRVGGTGRAEQLMTPRGQSKLQLVHSSIEPGGSGGNALNTINCEVEVLYVLRGAVELILSDRRQKRSAGDALTFAGGEPHSWVNANQARPAEVVWILVAAPWSGSA